MRVKTFYRLLKTISVVVLFFFMWTFGPMWQAVAYAATPQGQGSGGKGQVKQGQGSGSQGPGRPEERFEKAIEAIRENIGKADEKTAKGQDITTEVAEVKKWRIEIENIDIELRKEFAATEKKLKDAKLPKEILDRHYKFVKHYEDNLAELKTNLDGHEKAQKAQDKTLAKEYLKKIKLHLEKTKPPRKHVPLDPNKLPNRMVKAKARTPRLKKEDFEKDFPPQKKANKLASLQAILATDSHGLTRILNSAWSLPSNAVIGGTSHSALPGKPVLLAFNEIASDIPLSLGIQSATPQFAFSDSAPFLIAQVADLPTADDLAETVEVQFTDSIKAKAAELGYSPVKIYEWVRNNIEYVPTYGSIQGADMCLQTKQCNDFDTASLLMALLRASNIPARYVYGTVEVQIDKVTNWVGGFTDAQAALTFMASGGIPVAAGMSGGLITKARLEHVWVETNVAYGPYSGRSSNLNPDKIWVPLDPSYKQYTYTDGLDIQSTVPFDTQSFVNQIQSTATITQDYVTSVDSNYIQTTMTNYQTQIQNYISQNMPNATTGDIIGKKEIKKQELGILPVTLPYKVVTVGTKYSEVPDNLRHKISLNLLDENGSNALISITKSLPEIAGKKLTLSYSPASSADEISLINYANSTSSSIPVYLINLKPELRIDGQLVATGPSMGMGKIVPFNISLISPTTGVTNISNNNITGTYTAVVLDLSIMTTMQLDKIKARVAATKAKLDTNDLTNISKDDIMGEFLNGIGSSYWGMLDIANKIYARMNGVVDTRLPSEGTFTYDLQPSYLFEVPISAVPSGFLTDIDGDQHIVVAQDGIVSKEISFMAQIGMLGSRMEASVYDLTFNKAYTDKGITTAHIFDSANQQGIPLYTINEGNINAVLPALSLPDDVITDIKNAINAGKIVTVPKTSVTKDGWTGAGYLVFDSATGSGAYKISGGLSGGHYTCNCFGFSPGQEALIGLGLIILGFFAPIAAAVLGVLDGVISLASLFCQIDNPALNLTPDQKSILKATAVLIFSVGAILSGVGLVLALSAATIPLAVTAALVLFSVYWVILSIFMTWVIEKMIDIYLNNNNQQHALNQEGRIYVV